MAGNYIDKWNANGQEYDIQDAGRGLPLGVATLDNNGRIPYAQLPESAVEFKGYWNASTNTPHLADGSGTKGDMYYVDVAGSQDLGSGTQYFNVGDRVLYDGSIWKNINSTAVKSVNGVLPDAQGNVDIISKVYPVGSIYQNISDSTNPAILFGVGTWEQITDEFLAARGSINIGPSGGQWAVTLTANNLPRHKHLVDSHKHYMDHKHYTDIYHGHNYDDPGHSHGLSVFKNVANNGVDNGVLPIYNAGDTASMRYPIGASGVGITIQQGPSDRDRLSTESRYIGNEAVNRQYTDNQVTPDGISSNIYTDYQYAESPTAISIIPTYVGVYTWKRTA